MVLKCSSACPTMLRLNSTQLDMAFHNRYANNRHWWWYTPRHKWFEMYHAPHSLPAVPACYAILLDGRVIYVGQTSDLQSRFRAHKIKCRGDDDWETPWGRLSGDLRVKAKFAQKYGDWLMREARLILRLQPQFNVRGLY